MVITLPPDLSEYEDKYFSGQEAAQFLGVKPATLYAYASRGLIESIPAQNGRKRCYRLSDLIKLRQSARGFKSARDSESAVWTGPVIKSAITEIRNEGHCYRGQSALDLALGDIPFERVAELLWETEGSAPSFHKHDTTGGERQDDVSPGKRSDGSVPPGWKKVKPFKVPKRVRALIAPDTNYLDVVKLLLASLEITDTVSRQLLADNIFETARRLIVTMATAPGLVSENDSYICDGQFPIAQILLLALTGNKSKEKARLINKTLVLCADHELNASALAARIAASCDASLYSCLLSALGTFSGTFHGSASRRAEDIVSNSLKFKTTKAWLKDYLRYSPRIPGFGTELYTSGDPRSKMMIETAQSISSKNEYLKRLIEIVEAVREQLGLEPNLDVGLAAISYALALPPGSGSTIFAVSRTSGWIAHAIEQRTYGGMIRPRARYIGKT